MITQGERLKQIRTELRLSQAKLGNSLGISAPSIGKAEKDVNRLSNESLSRLLKNHNININYLLNGTGEMFIKKD